MSAPATILLWTDPGKNAAPAPELCCYLLPGEKNPRPAVLVIPGGGYGCVCESTEGEPIARKFNELGFHAFVLHYRVAPHRFPEPQEETPENAAPPRREVPAVAPQSDIAVHDTGTVPDIAAPSDMDTAGKLSQPAARQRKAIKIIVFYDDGTYQEF